MFSNYNFVFQFVYLEAALDVQFTNLSGSMAGFGSGFTVIMGLSALLVSIIA